MTPHPAAPNPQILAYYADLAEHYDQDRFGGSYGQLLHQAERKLLRRWLPARGRILDLACGTGRMLDLATEGLDASPEMLAVARRRHPDRPLHLGPAWRLPHADASLDAIFSLHLMMHLPPAEREAILAEGARALRPGGLFIFDIPSAERRRLTRPRAQGWHGGSAMTVAQLRAACPQLHLRETRGLLALPLHRLPEALRPAIAPVEALLGASPLSPWCSYHLACLERR